MKRSFAALAAGVAVVAALLVAGVVSAHAPITYIRWDVDTNPTRLIASTDNREMVAEAGSFYLRVYNSSGSRVDNGDATITPDRLEIHVSLQPNLPAGAYRVDWLTTSTDGAVLSGSESVPLPGSFGEPPSAEGDHDEAEEHEEGEEQAEETESEPVSPPSTGDAGLASDAGGATAAYAAVASLLVTAGGLWFARARRS